MAFPRNARLLALLIVSFLVSCSGKGELRGVQRKDLFKLSYGPGETQIDFTPGSSGAPPGKLRIAMREGIFHISNGQGGKLLRLSSYGDILAMFYEPARTASPFLLAPAADATERYAVALDSFAPGDLAVDSLQRVYVEDRLPAKGRVFDGISGAWCDRVVRRFGKGGVELNPLGQEGLGGTPFPAILGIYVVDGDDIVVISASEAMLMAHRFSPEGILRNILRFPRDALPVPESMRVEADAGKIRAYPEGLIPFGAASDPRLALSCGYMRETIDSASESIDSVDYAGSYLYELDMSSGAILAQIVLANENEAEPALELLGKIGDEYILAETKAEEQDRLTIRRITSSGSVRRRMRLDLPGAALSVPDLLLSSDGSLCALIEMEDGIGVSYWKLGMPLTATSAGVAKSAASGTATGATGAKEREK